MDSSLAEQKKTARLAGLYYLIIVLLGIFVIMVVPPQIVVSGDPTATFSNLLEKEYLFRASIVLHVVSTVAFVLLVLALYDLLYPFGRRLAHVMAAFVLVQVPAVLVSEALNFSALMIAKGRFFPSLDLVQQQEWVAYLLRTVKYIDEDVAMVYWGLWLIPLGILVVRSGFIPKIFGHLLLAGGVAYIVEWLVFFMMPGVNFLPFNFLFVFYALGEISFTLWLLIQGVRSSTDGTTLESSP